VLDALLEDGRIALDGASGTSAGAMNAVVLAHGLARARQDGLKGQDVHEAARAAQALLGRRGPAGQLHHRAAAAGHAGRGVVVFAVAHAGADQPAGVNPLRRLLLDQVDFDLLDSVHAMKVFVCATNVRTGGGEVFSGKRLTVDAVMASACLPTLFKPVEIAGELYWDGGYSGNPALYPLIYNTRSNDMVLVQINPVAVPFKADADAQDIMERINEITFNAPLLAEFRAIEFVARLLDEGRLDPPLPQDAAAPRRWRRGAARLRRGQQDARRHRLSAPPVRARPPDGPALAQDALSQPGRAQHRHQALTAKNGERA
jgi:NTE family protein